MKKNIFRFLTGLSIFIICGAPSIRFDALFPAFVPIPSHINSIGLVNRTATDEKLINIIEGTISGEFIGQDKAVSQQVLGGLMATLKESKKVEVVKVKEALIRKGVTKLFPEALSWYEVHKLCEEYHTDALIVLELYDSDYPAGTNTVIVTAGFRFYDPANETIYDEYILKHSRSWGGPKNENLLGTLNRFLVNDEVVNDASFDAGILYGQRISPSWFSVERKYYKRSKRDDNLAMGARMMEANDWDGAIVYLQKAIENGHRKTGGRASHNLAIVYEILGDLETAKDYAQKAYTIYNNKESKNYIQILNNRMLDVKRLKLQENQE
jgi:tetratricopeptide (TPR) repeat protein